MPLSKESESAIVSEYRSDKRNIVFCLKMQDFGVKFRYFKMQYSYDTAQEAKTYFPSFSRIISLSMACIILLPMLRNPGVPSAI